MVDGPGDVPAPQLRAGAAGVLIRIARIDDDDIARGQGGPPLVERRPGRGERRGHERRRGDGGGAPRARAILEAPPPQPPPGPGTPPGTPSPEASRRTGRV